MRILHILDHSIPLHSGYTFRTRAILEHQRRHGFETFHLTSSKHRGSALGAEEVDGLRFYRTPPGPGWLERLPLIRQWAVVEGLVRRLDAVIEEVRPDILHAHSPALNGLAALRAGRRHGLPVVYECRAFWEDAAVDHGTSRAGGPRYRATRALETRVFRRADAVTTICEGLRRDIIGRGIGPEKVTVIPNAVDPERFRLAGVPDPELRQQLGLDGSGVVLGFIGSFYAYEGLPLLLQALPEIREARPGTVLLLAGGGPQEEYLRTLAQRMGLNGAVRFVGRVSHDQVQRYYDLVDLLIYPRRSLRLTELVTPLKPLEAMAQGRLVLASDVGGHRELIDDGRTGWLFPPDDAAALARAVDRVLGQRSDWPAVRRAARTLIETERNWSHSVARYRGVYGKILGGGREQ